MIAFGHGRYANNGNAGTKEHQAADWEKHKGADRLIKNSSTRLDREEQALRRESPMIFRDHVGHFWGLLQTRDYMRARFGLVEAILKIRTYDAVSSALEHLMDMLRLCRGDNMGVRDLVAHLLLRLGKDQKCYDFVKWWATVNADGQYDWGDMSLPYLDVENADVFEPVDYLCGDFPNLISVVSVTLLKIRLLLVLQNYSEGSAVLSGIKVEKRHRIETGKLPREIVNHMQEYLGSAIIGNWKDKDVTQLIKDLNSQVNKLYKTVERANRHFWPALLKPGKHLEARPGGYSMCSVEEMQVKLPYSFYAWQESPGALEYIKEKATAM